MCTAYNKQKLLEECEQNGVTIKSPLKAIREKCIDCNCGQSGLVEYCPIKNCTLWPFRWGKNPFSNKGSRELTEEQRKVLADRMKSARENIKKNRS